MLTRKTVFISGVSSGFGKLTVPLLLQKGHVVIAGLRGGEARLQGLFASELEKFPGQLHAIDLHLEKSSEFPKVAQWLNERFGGKLDVLINNAGYGLLGNLEDQSEEQIRYQMEINFFGAAFLTRALLPALRAARGRVLNVTSLAGLAGFPFYGSYSASKFALEGLSECLYYDLKPFEVQVGSIEPGGFKTEFVRARQFGDRSNDPASAYYSRNQAFLKAFEMTAARLDDPAKVAAVISRLCDVRKVPLRSRVGKDAFLMLALKRFLPKGLQLWIVDRAFGLALSRASR